MELDSNRITGGIIAGAIDVHRYLGPGMLEHTYEVCLQAALRQRGLQVERQVPVPVPYLDVNAGISIQLSGISHRPLADS